MSKTQNQMDKFCKNCGTPLSPVDMACTKCGVAAGTGNTFCPQCGAKPAENAAVCVNCGYVINRRALKDRNYKRINPPARNPAQAFKNCFGHLNSRGRACRNEYWSFIMLGILPILAIIIGLQVALDNNGDMPEEVVFIFGGIAVAWGIVLTIFGFGAMVRRLHDTGKSGGYFFISLIPAAGPILLFVQLLKAGEPGYNRYGSNPADFDAIQKYMKDNESRQS